MTAAILTSRMSCTTRDVCVIDKSGTCDTDLCRQDADAAACTGSDTCAIDNPEAGLLIGRRTFAKRGLNRAVKWLYELASVLIVVAGVSFAAISRARHRRDPCGLLGSASFRDEYGGILTVARGGVPQGLRRSAQGQHKRQRRLYGSRGQGLQGKRHPRVSRGHYLFGFIQFHLLPCPP